MSKKEEKSNEYSKRVSHGNPMIKDYIECAFETGWKAAMEYLYSLPIRESILEICKESKGNKEINEKKKCLEDIRWKAEKNSSFYYINSFMYVAKGIEDNKAAAKLHYNNGNYFRTEEAAQKIVGQIKEIFKNSKAE